MDSSNDRIIEVKLFSPWIRVEIHPESVLSHPNSNVDGGPARSSCWCTRKSVDSGMEIT